MTDKKDPAAKPQRVWRDPNGEEEIFAGSWWNEEASIGAHPRKVPRADDTSQTTVQDKTPQETK